ncbi:hypothetical protein CFAM422_012212 [Trichoderma lentiforme]|uniref:Uncharacterized protein n=1 Tax=Trichoderma lentiforme TaxID=1567552 RepID=A0A9P4X4Q4_9HYPO|nr:hypothetical protein CFAM422_012212 [Trichoderma lentiforme]
MRGWEKKEEERKKQKIAPDETTNDCGVCLASFAGGGTEAQRIDGAIQAKLARAFAPVAPH